MKKLIIVLLVMFFLLCTCVAIGSADTGTTDETENETETTGETEVAAECFWMVSLSTDIRKNRFVK